MLNLNFPAYPFLLFFISISIVPRCDSKNILVYNAVGTHSTRLSMWPYIEALANNGHNVTFLSAFENNESVKKHPNIYNYVPEKWAAMMGPWENHYDFYSLRKNEQGPQTFYSISGTGLLGCQVLYSDPDFVEWVKSSKFDLVVVEAAVNECAYGLVHYFKAKHIMYSTSSAWPQYIDQHGFPVESSSITDIAFTFPPGNEMSFWQRLVNTLHPIAYDLHRKYFYLPLLEKITSDALGIQDNMPSFEEIERNASLILLTSHYSLDYPRSFPPYVIPIGGVVSAGKKMKPMPKEMEKFVNDGDNNGFIFISFGTVAEFTNFDKGVQQEFINALLKFPNMRFVWKLTNGLNVALPENILVTKWAPQQTLLAHSKIKAFITHAGMGSAVEAIHHSVPMICIPVLGDQDLNAGSISSKGAGIRLEIVDMEEHELENAISEILHNKTYRKNMNTLTEIFHERPVPPLESAVWWTEFVMKHDNSNKFLHPPSIQQPWYIKRGLDVWITVLVFVALTLSLSIYILLWIGARTVKLLAGTNSASQSAKKLKRK